MYLVWRIKIFIGDRKLAAVIIAIAALPRKTLSKFSHAYSWRLRRCYRNVCNRNSNLTMCVNSNGTRQSRKTRS